MDVSPAISEPLSPIELGTFINEITFQNVEITFRPAGDRKVIFPGHKLSFLKKVTF